MARAALNLREFAALAVPLGRRRAAARLLMPVVARIHDQAVWPEPQHRAPGKRRLLAVLRDEERPVLHNRPVTVLDGLPEPDFARGGVGVGPARVLTGVLELAKGMRAVDAVFR